MKDKPEWASVFKIKKVLQIPGIMAIKPLFHMDAHPSEDVEKILKQLAFELYL
jgi:hypothetical protein